MTTQKKFKIIKTILGAHYHSNNEALFYCPYCKHDKRKLSVNVDKNVFKCWVCDTSGRDLRRIVRKYGDFKQLQEWDELTNRVDLGGFEKIFTEISVETPEQVITLPAEFKSLANSATPFTALYALKYLTKRDVFKEDILRWKIGYCDSGEYANRIVIPSFNLDGRVNYFVARSWNSSFQRYKNPPVSRDICFNELYIDWDSDLVITEGIFDAIRAGPNAIPLLGSTLRESSKLFQKIIKHDTPVYVALDSDASKKEDRIINLMLRYGVEAYKIDTSGYEDVAEMSKLQFMERKENATFIAHGDYLLRKALSNI
tara:strand:- start:9 stop:950 length:942 start_codon:yes stop_codon:yes gene_type:complete